MRSILFLLLVAAIAVADEPAAPVGPDDVRWQGHRGDMPLSSLDVELIPDAAAQRTSEGIRLPLRIVNRSPHAISTHLSYEWDPGLFRLTDLYASISSQESRPFWPAPLIGARPDHNAKTTTIVADGVHEVELRMDGTGSFGRDNFMESGIPGMHRMRLLLVFEAQGKQQYVVSKEFEVDLPNTPLSEFAQPREGARPPIQSEPNISDALRIELVKLDAMRSGLDTNLDEVDRTGQQLLEKFNAPEHQAQIYVQLAHVHAQSGLRKPDQVVAYVKKAFEHPLPLQQSLMLCTNWGDALSVRSRPLAAEDRIAAATAYVLGLKRLAAYDVPATYPHLPDAPPVPNGIPADLEGLRKLNQYQTLRGRADFIRELIVQKDILVRQLKDLYDPRRFVSGDRTAELGKFKQLVREQLGDEGEPLYQIVQAQGY